MNSNNNNLLPKDGFSGFMENFKGDALSGFLVFLLALPLSLGIAGASNFPPVYGLITALVGGLVVSFFSGSILTIKGPAAGLIVIVSGAVVELGRGNLELGWHLTLGVVVISGALQILFGLLKLGRFSDVFPSTAVHGMLTAIGIIIISKQLHIIFGMNPLTERGKPMVEPLELLVELKNTFQHMFKFKEVATIGLISLFIVFAWPHIPLKNLRKIPSALIVLLVSIALVNFLGIKNDPVHKYMPLLDFKNGFFDIIGINESFNGIFHFGTFLKYLVLFTLIGSLESLLTVRAVDRMDPYNRTSNVNKDLIALGLGNIVAGILGGLPMIAEVARSSSNVANGAKTRWSNFFHGIFILLFLIFATSFSNLIPKSALAAMLIGVGWKLAHPKEFVHIAKIGLDQIIVFATTILVTLFIDLLIGIAAGILIKLVLHVARGVSISALFNPRLKVHKQRITVRGALVFSNFMKVKTKIGLFPSDSKVVLDVRQCRLVDHSVVESLEHLRREFVANGGELKVYGIDEFRPVKKSSHPLSARIKMNK